MYNVLFIGGPLDGRREKFQTLMPFYRYAVAPRYRPEDFINPSTEISSVHSDYETVLYHLCHIDDLFFYAPSAVNSHEAIKILFTRYPLPLPDNAKH